METQTEPLDLDRLRGWIGREEEAEDVVTPRLLASLRATLASEQHFRKRSGHSPVMTHWCLTPEVVPMADIDIDGHPKRGGFLPPIPLPRRMWAASRVSIRDALQAGDLVTRRSRIADVTVKSGQGGLLCFVEVDHSYSTVRGTVIEDRQTIVYREQPKAGARSAVLTRSDRPAPRQTLTLHASELLLFRYSALTFNGHRIHYDQPYTTGEEGYSDLVVHGPLQVSLLAEFAADLHEGEAPKQFSFRGLSPLFACQDFNLNAGEFGSTQQLWVTDSHGIVTAESTAQW